MFTFTPAAVRGRNVFKRTWSSVSQFEILIWKFLAINALSPGSVMFCEVTSLKHEFWDNTVENGSLVAKPLFTSAQGSEVLCCFRYCISKQLKIR